MKPQNWNKLSNKEKKEISMRLLQSHRGQYLISQALWYGMRELRKENYPEESNAQDMEILSDLFPIFFVVKAAEEKYEKMQTPDSRN